MLNDYTIVVDKLYLLFDYPQYQLENLKSVFTDAGYIITSSDLKYVNNNYHYSFDVKDNSGNILYCVHYNHRKQIRVSKIMLMNTTLYSRDFSKVLALIATLPLPNLRPAHMEIAIDTNSPLPAIYKNRISKSVIRYSKGYESVYSGREKHRKQHDKETKYIQRETSFSKHPRVRIENKTEQLFSKPKPYITTFHARNGLDISKSIYRIELTLPLSSFTISRNKVILNQDGNDYITYNDYKALPDTIEARTKDIFSPVINISNPKKIDYSRAATKVISYYIDLFRLAEPDYLFSLFDLYVKGIFNYKRIIKPVYNKQVIAISERISLYLPRVVSVEGAGIDSSDGAGTSDDNGGMFDNIDLNTIDDLINSDYADEYISDDDIAAP